MENQSPPSRPPSKQGLVSSIIHYVLSYYGNLVNHPFRTGLAYFIAGIMGALFVGWILFPLALYSTETQPLQFNHAIHTSPDIVDGDTELDRCLTCHGFREDGTFVGIPTMEKCMECHDDPDSTLGEEPEEERFLKEYVAKGKEVPWLVYSRQPDCVYFSHIAHVGMSKLECRTCHGNHGSLEELPPYKENRLTGYSIDIWGRNIAGIKFHPWDRMKMDDCGECHTRMGHEENNACFVCHK